jgi:ribonuclease R
MTTHELHSAYEGVISINSKGAGYIKHPDFKDSVFVDNENINTALHGDMVSFEPNPQKESQPVTGKVTAVLVRSKKGFAGVLEEQDGKYFVVPQDKKMYTDICIPKEKLKGAVAGQKVFATITDWKDAKKSPFGIIDEVLGAPGNNDVEMRSIALEKGFGHGFPEEVDAAAKHLYDEGIGEAQMVGRRDFRKVHTCTIDPFDAKDFDDALSFEKLPNGNYEIGVHIADVSHYLEEGGVIDAEAVKRQTSVYLVDRVIPMLPEVLSNDLCSLVEGKDRLTYAAVFEVTKEGNILSTWIGRTVINSSKRFSYEEAQEIIEKKEGLFVEEIGFLNDVAKILCAQRFEHGAISLDTEEVKFKLDENGVPIGVYVKDRKDAHKMIEEWMLLANRSVSEYVAKLAEDEPNVFVYRVHALPSEEKMLDLSIFLQNLGHNIKLHDGQLVPRELNALLRSLDGHPEKDVVQIRVTRSMQKAIYSTDNIGHYGLAFEHYTHFTSPIRRYPDVLVHRLLTTYLSGKQVAKDKWHLYETLCGYASTREKEASDAERGSIKYKQVEYMSSRIGQEFDGIVSGLADWGVFVEDKESKSEGLIRLRDLGDDFYTFDEKKYVIKGEKYKQVFELGQKVRIKLVKTDMEAKTIDFILVPEQKKD